MTKAQSFRSILLFFSCSLGVTGGNTDQGRKKGRFWEGVCVCGEHKERKCKERSKKERLEVLFWVVGDWKTLIIQLGLTSEKGKWVCECLIADECI